ncbi:filaggrin isoform X1 [Lingula anatina]|uniref:Filaggrin isoform X1 n=1 Tax=Lingula anatina TaxID=7574 RepID=A0A1S3HVJ7_LINAN|nr:filaggrin isoform X1 [Lingula anatina]|eukprot:XP_013390048.1 filaggrin isoform X1 [Lingula anatina]
MRNHGQEDSMRNSKMSRGGEYPERSPSEQLVDLHVYVMPPDLWRENKNNAVNEVISEMSSAGFIRVHPQQKIYELRSEIEVQLGGNNVPKEYVFLKSVGRCLTRVRPKQEVELKAKNFVPPQAYLPEIFVLEATPELRELFKNDSPRTVTNHRSPGSSQQSPYFQRTQNGYNAREMSYNDTAKYDGNTYGHGRRGHSFETAENGLYPGHSQRQGAISSHATQTGARRFTENKEDKMTLSGTPTPPQSGDSSGSSTVRSTGSGEFGRVSRGTSPVDFLSGRAEKQLTGHSKGSVTGSGQRINGQFSPNDRHGFAERTIDKSKVDLPRQSTFTEKLPPIGSGKVNNGEFQDSNTEANGKSPRNRKEFSEGQNNKHDDVKKNEKGQNLNNTSHPSSQSKQNTHIKEQIEGLHSQKSGTNISQNQNENGQKRVASVEQNSGEFTAGKQSQGANGEVLSGTGGGDGQNRDSQIINNQQQNSGHMLQGHKGGSVQNETGTEDSKQFQSPGHTIPSHQAAKDGKNSISDPSFNENHQTSAEHDAHITGKDGRGKGHSQSPDTRSANTHTTNGDSGIADGTPDREFRRDRTRDTLDRRKNDSGHGGGSHLDGTSEGTREDRQKQEDPSHGWVEEERRRLESKERHRLERKGGDSQEQGSEEEAWSQDNAEGLDSGSPNSLSRFPSPPPLTLESINSADSNLRESSSARERRQQEKEKLLAELEVAREERKEVERKREELVKKAKQLQHKTNNRRNQARDIWKKKYFEEKKKTPPLEDQCNKLRHEIEVLHRRLMSQLEGTKDARHDGKAPGLPSQKNNYKIQATRLHHETEELRRKVENAKMKLTAEMKLRNQAETELRALRAELTQKKINVTLTRSQQMAALGSSHDVFSPRTPVATPR